MGLEQFSLADRTAIVTGASYGLGVRFATTLAEAGANVVLAARSADKLADTAAKVEALGVKALVQPCDVTDPAAVKAVVAATWDTFGRADILVNNAGAVAEAGMVPERIPDELFATTVATNLNGLFTFCREVGSRQLADGRGGSIINVASVAGIGAQPHFPSAYQASKAAVINLTRNLGASWAKRGVRVNALCPGWFPSEMTAPFFAMPAYWSRVVAMTPMARAGLEHELDGALLFLASDASSFMTGATLAIDGGLTSTVGAVDYDDDMFLTLETVVGELGAPTHPTGGRVRSARLTSDGDEDRDEHPRSVGDAVHPLVGGLPPVDILQRGDPLGHHRLASRPLGAAHADGQTLHLAHAAIALDLQPGALQERPEAEADGEIGAAAGMEAR